MIQNYYAVPSNQVNFNDAIRLSSEATFAGVRGHLFLPNSQVEFERVVVDIVQQFHRDAFWIAVTDSASEGKWIAAAGPNAGTDMFDLLPWRRGEPNGGTGENCAVHAPGYAWIIDTICHQALKYVIEFACPFGQRFNDQGTGCIGELTDWLKMVARFSSFFHS